MWFPYETHESRSLSSVCIEPQKSTRLDHRALWKRALRTKGVIPTTEVFVKSMFDDVLAGKKIIFLDPLLFHYWLGRLYERLPRGEFYLGKEAVLHPAMCMWLNRKLNSHIAKVIHTRWAPRIRQNATIKTLENVGRRSSKTRVYRTKQKGYVKYALAAIRTDTTIR